MTVSKTDVFETHPRLSIDGGCSMLYNRRMDVRPTNQSQTTGKMEEYQRRLTYKGGVTIPIEVRRALGVEPKGEVRFRVSDGRVELLPAVMTFKQTFASVKVKQHPLDFDELRREAIEEHVKKAVAKMNK
jgi:bifunctional DNA-binding transcriptional regulator/antitoxin component of YhaV-PrlF toxin-antitoxin module